MSYLTRLKDFSLEIMRRPVSWVSKITVEMPDFAATDCADNKPLSCTRQDVTSPSSRGLTAGSNSKFSDMDSAVKPRDGVNDVLSCIEKPICYVLKDPSLVDKLLLANACKQAGLTNPYRVFFLHQPERILASRQLPAPPAWMKELIAELDQDTIADIQLVPVTICVGRAPDKEQSSFKLLFSFSHGPLGRVKKLLSLLIHGRNTLVHFNAPVSLQRVVQEKQDQELVLRKLARLLRVHFRKQREQIVGPDLSHRRTLIRSIINTPAVQAAIAREAKNSKISYEDARKKALAYGHEIASDFSFAAVRFLERIMQWFWTKFFSSVEVSNLDKVKEISYQSTVIYAPCHRSHLDYLLLSYVLYRNGLTIPHVAGGINLNMPLIGPLLRRGGAFFIRRSFSGNALYGAVFTEYMHNLLVKGFPLEYFIEGGRSRTGRTLRPKTGLLSMTLASCLRQQNKSVHIVPIYVGYERIMEGSTYLGELRGKAKQKETPMALLKAISRLKMNFGSVHVNFGEPIDLQQFLRQHAPEGAQAVEHGSRMPWLNQCSKHLGDVIAERINQAIAVNPINLLAIVMLATPRLSISREELLVQLAVLKAYLQGVSYSDKLVLTTLEPAAIIARGLELNLVQQQRDSLGEIVYLEGSQGILMTYYRNNVLHLFSLVGVVSGMLLHQQACTEEAIIALVQAIYPYLRVELYCGWEEGELKAAVRQALVTLEDLQIIKFTGNEYQSPEPTSTHYRSLVTLANTTQEMLERYYIVVSMLLHSHDRGLTSTKLQERCRKIAERLGFLYGLNAPEFFDKTLFAEFIRQLEVHGLLVTTEGKVSYTDDLVALNRYLEQVLRSSPVIARSVSDEAIHERVTSCDEL